MRTYPVVNLGPVPRASRHMGQVREFEILSDQVLARLCIAVEDYNNADTSWSSPDAAAGERTQRDATAAIQDVIDRLPPGLRNFAIGEIRRYCPDADAVLDTVRKPGPGTLPLTSEYPWVATEPGRRPLPPLPPTVPSVAESCWYDPSSGEYGWGVRPAGAQSTGLSRRDCEERMARSQEIREFPPAIPTGPMETGSEEPFELEPPPPPLPPVETPSVGCWYVMGKGYMWGPRPSGGESTGLNQKDCEALRVRDIEVRTGQAQVSQQAFCDPLKGQFFDPRTGQCRGSVSSFPGAPFGLPGASGGVAAPSLTGRRRRSHGGGNIEWWMYQQAFLPQLFFSRPRAHYATLGVGKPVPPGICCQATPDGGAICSTGQGFPPT